MSRTVRVSVISSINAGQVHSESPEKKHMVQIEQANRMICQQRKDIENQGGIQMLLWLYRWITGGLVMLLE
jgi:hypothetical protein